MTEKIEAKVTHRFAASPEQVFDALVDPQSVARWHRAWLRRAGLAGDVTQCRIDPQVGGAFLFADRRDGEETRHWGTFLALDRPTRLSFTWIADASEADDPAEVTIIVEPEPDGSGSVVTLYNEMDARWADSLPRTEQGWRALLEGVEQVLEQR